MCWVCHLGLKQFINSLVKKSGWAINVTGRLVEQEGSACEQEGSACEQEGGACEYNKSKWVWLW